MDMLLDMLLGKRRLPIPEDAKLQSFWRDREIDDFNREAGVVLCLALEHPTFAPVTWRVPVVDVIERKQPLRAEVAPARKKSALA